MNKAMTEIRFWWFRVRVSIYGSWVFKSFGWWGFADEESERDSFEFGESVRDHFIEAWCRE